jgi:hypothetical protein
VGSELWTSGLGMCSSRKQALWHRMLRASRTMLSVASVRKGSILARDATAKRGAELVAGQL